VISIGNIAFGGTGKTPLVIFLAKQFDRVAVLARGYGGDEMKVVARHVPKAMLYEGKDRVRLARQAEKDGAKLILLDDGFQHRRLHRDLDVVVLGPKGGLRRESERRLKDAFVLEETKIKAWCPVDLRGERVGIFCGIGNPERFKKTVEGLGAIVVGKLFLRDHEPVGIKRLEKFYKSLDVRCLLCTEKDEVKLPSTQIPVHAVRIEVLADGLENLVAKIEEKLDN